MKTILTTTLALGVIVFAGNQQANAIWPFSSSCGSCFERTCCEPRCCEERVLPCNVCGPVTAYNCQYGACRFLSTYY